MTTATRAIGRGAYIAVRGVAGKAEIDRWGMSVIESDSHRVEALLRERAEGLRRTRRGWRQPVAGTEELLQRDVSPERAVRGLCVACGGPIRPERLSAIPHAVRCVGCQLEFEHAQMRTPPHVA